MRCTYSTVDIFQSQIWCWELWARRSRLGFPARAMHSVRQVVLKKTITLWRGTAWAWRRRVPAGVPTVARVSGGDYSPDKNDGKEKCLETTQYFLYLFPGPLRHHLVVPVSGGSQILFIKIWCMVNVWVTTTGRPAFWNFELPFF